MGIEKPVDNKDDLLNQLDWGINKDSHIPLYHQVKQAIYNKILDGYWSKGELIPSERQLGQMMGVSRITVIRALKELTDEGLLVREKGKGTFVTGQRNFNPAVKRVGVVIHQAEFFADSFFSDIVKGIQDTARKLDFEVALLPYSDSLPEVKEGYYCIENVLQKELSGMIITVEEMRETELSRLHEHKIPFVVINKDLINVEGHQLTVDWSKGTYELTQCLIERGHRDFGYLGGLWGTYRSDSEKYTGFQRALSEAGLKINTDWFVEWEYRKQEGFSAVSKRILLADPRPTAILCSDDHLAAQLIKTCYQEGIKIPDDVAVTGVGDLDIANNVYPGITTLHVDRYDLGKRAMLIIKSAFTGDLASGAYVKEVVKPYVVVRESI